MRPRRQMAIHPIDLQTMYSQLSNVAKQAASQQQGAQLAASVYQEKAVRENLEESARVQRTTGDQSKSASVDGDGKNQDGGREREKRKRDGSDEEPPQPEQGRVQEPYLGRHIDITR